MSLTTHQIERLRALTGHPKFVPGPMGQWDEQTVEDYIGLLDHLADLLRRRPDDPTRELYDRHRHRLCDKLGLRPGPEFASGSVVGGQV